MMGSSASATPRTSGLNELADLFRDAWLVDMRTTSYKLDVGLEALLASSFLVGRKPG